jgi:hypothetical protein
MSVQTRIGTWISNIRDFGLVVACFMLALGAAPRATALPEAYCRDYARQAAQQSVQKSQMPWCKYYDDPATPRVENHSTWWNSREDHHFGWCRLEQTVERANQGLSDRQSVLTECASQRPGEAARPAGPFAEPAAFECPYVLGSAQFRPEQIKAYLNPPRPGWEGASVVCDYYMAEGQIRLQAHWNESVQWAVTPTPKGCARLARRNQVNESATGVDYISEDRQAVASISATSYQGSPYPYQIAKNAALGPLKDVFLFAELRAKPCW